MVRDQQGLTQRQAAATAEMRFQYLSNPENGRIRNPSFDTLAKLATAYGRGVDDLVGHGRAYDEKDLPVGLRELLADPDWAPELTPPWIETLLGIEHNGRHLDTKQEFLEAFLALRRILGT